jgi:hypothetical protein
MPSDAVAGDQAAEEMPGEPDPLRTAAYFATEALVPGGSHFVKGDLRQGLIYVLVGGIARSALGAPGAILVGASSFTKATRGKHLHDLIGPFGRPSGPSDRERIARLEAALAAKESQAGPARRQGQ